MTRKKPVGCSRLDEVTQSLPRYLSAQLQIQIQTAQLQCIQADTNTTNTRIPKYTVYVSIPEIHNEL